MTRPAPDFVIVGAPKCGTTALYAGLQKHPGLALSTIKEPRYFAYDFPGRREMDTDADYEALFARGAKGRLRGEASAIYLHSEIAIPALLKRRPDVKLIALVRNPVEMFVSWHNECLKSLDENERNPETAWRLQRERASGKLPRLCIEPKYLQYREICALGTQIKRFYELVPAGQRLVVVWNDLNCIPATVYKNIADFLGVEDIGIGCSEKKNSYGTHRLAIVPRVVRAFYADPVLRSLRRRFKPVLNSRGLFPLLWAVDFSLKQVAKPRLSSEFRRELLAEFRPEVELLEMLLGRDFSEWKAESGSKSFRVAS